MTFYVQGLNSHEAMSLTQVFDKGVVEKIHAINAENRINPSRTSLNLKQKNKQAGLASDAYSESGPSTSEVLKMTAGQIMISPVTTLRSANRIMEIIAQFRLHQFRHIPVVTKEGKVEGMVSERDLLHHIASLDDDYQHKTPHSAPGVLVSQIMKTRVLTASQDTDIRYIARLFIEQRIGAMPIVYEGVLKGIITRSDILGTLVQSLNFKVWA